MALFTVRNDYYCPYNQRVLLGAPTCEPVQYDVTALPRNFVKNLLDKGLIVPSDADDGQIVYYTKVEDIPTRKIQPEKKKRGSGLLDRT